MFPIVDPEKEIDTQKDSQRLPSSSLKRNIRTSASQVSQSPDNRSRSGCMNFGLLTRDLCCIRQCLRIRDRIGSACATVPSRPRLRGGRLTVTVDRDMPPAGGFANVKYKRNLPFRGPSGLVILGGVTAVCAYGFYRVGLGNLEKRYVVVVQTLFLYYSPFEHSWGSAATNGISGNSRGFRLQFPRSGQTPFLYFSHNLRKSSGGQIRRNWGTKGVRLRIDCT